MVGNSIQLDVSHGFRETTKDGDNQNQGDHGSGDDGNASQDGMKSETPRFLQQTPDAQQGGGKQNHQHYGRGVPDEAEQEKRSAEKPKSAKRNDGDSIEFRESFGQKRPQETAHAEGCQ